MALNRLDRSTPVVDANGVPLQNLQLFSEELANTQLIIGTGTPEGVQKARMGRMYMDQSGNTGSILYIKKTSDVFNDQTRGWVLV